MLKGKSSVDPTLPWRLEEAKDTMIKIADSLGRIQSNASMNIIPAEYSREKCSFAIMEVVYEWSRGIRLDHIRSYSIPSVRCLDS